jgi:hypothetical protein
MLELSKEDAALVEHIRQMLRTTLRQHDKKGSDWTYAHTIVDGFCKLLCTQGDRAAFIAMIDSHMETTPFKLARRH